MFTKFGMVTIPVKDQDAALAFYTSILGGRKVQDMPMMPGSRWLLVELPGVDTRIVLANWFKQMPPGSVQGVVLFTGDMQKTVAELKQRGLAVSEIKQQPYGLEATFNDPDGNGWVLEQPAAG